MTKNIRFVILKKVRVLLLIISAPVFAGDVTLVSPQLLSQWGYHPTNKLTYLKSYCDKWSGLTSNVTYQAIKSNAPVAGHTQTFYRYTLIREQYEKKEQLNERLLMLHNPLNLSSKHSKLCNIRKIFTNDLVIYVLHTDAEMFSGSEMIRIFSLYQLAIDN